MFWILLFLLGFFILGTLFLLDEFSRFKEAGTAILCLIFAGNVIFISFLLYDYASKHKPF
jgi:ABC-type Na+ efflux pump permease subunit